MRPVYNPINPGFHWAQAFDFPTGWLDAGDHARAEFRQTPLSGARLAHAETEDGGVIIESDRLFIFLTDDKTAGWQVQEVVTNIVIRRTGVEIPIGQIFTIPVRWLPTRAIGSLDAAIAMGREQPIRVSLASGTPIKIGVVQGVPGPRGIDGAPGTSFQFVQTAPSNIWTIAHNLGFRPSVSTLDTGNGEMIGRVNHLSANTLTITFNIPVAGSAHLV